MGVMLPRNLRVTKVLIYLVTLAGIAHVVAQDRPNIPPDAISRTKSFVLPHNGQALLYNYDAGTVAAPCCRMFISLSAFHPTPAIFST